jgi:flagellar motor switch protein FliM
MSKATPKRQVSRPKAAAAAPAPVEGGGGQAVDTAPAEPAPAEGETTVAAAPDEVQSAVTLAQTEGTGAETLPQTEAERLAQEVGEEPIPVPAGESAASRPRFKSEDVRPYDFRQAAFLTGNELRKTRLRHTEFVQSLAAQLSVYLRLEVTLQMTKLETLSYQKFCEALPSPTHLTLFKVEPREGVCLLDLSPRLGLTLVDRLLGGSAQSVDPTSEMSEIEMALLDQVAQLVLNEWCQLWRNLGSARPVLLGHENNGRFLNTSPPDTMMLVVAMEVALGDCVESMQLAFPFATIEPLVRQPGQNRETAGTSRRSPLNWNELFDDLPIRINTEWHGLELSARDLAGLKPGDVLMLDANCFNQVEVRFERLPRFHGRLGTSGERLAVELTRPVKT